MTGQRSDLSKARKAGSAAYEHAADEMHREARWQTEQAAKPGGREIHSYAAERASELERTFRFLASVAPPAEASVEAILDLCDEAEAYTPGLIGKVYTDEIRRALEET